MEGTTIAEVVRYRIEKQSPEKGLRQGIKIRREEFKEEYFTFRNAN
jgi:hypothetical protein